MKNINDINELRFCLTEEMNNTFIELIITKQLLEESMAEDIAAYHRKTMLDFMRNHKIRYIICQTLKHADSSLAVISFFSGAKRP